MFQVPVWYAVLGRFARATLRVAHSERTGPWPPYQTDLVLSGAEASVWIHAASLGETKGVLALLRHLPSHVGVTLTATTTAGRERLRKSGHEAFLLPCDDHRTVSDFLATRHIQKALFLEAEAWPAILGTLQKAKIPTAFAAFRSSPTSMRRWRLFSKVFPGWTKSVDTVWTDTPRSVGAVKALGFSSVRPGVSLKWAGIPFQEALGTGPHAAISLHLRDLPILRSLVRESPHRGWLWFPRRPWQAALFRAWARLLAVHPVASKTPGPGEVYVSNRFGEVAALVLGCRSAWVSPGHDTEEPFRLGVASVSTGRPPREIARPEDPTDSAANEIVSWLLKEA